MSPFELLGVILFLVVYFLVVSLVVKFGAYLVSAPNSSYAVALAYTAFSFGIYVIIALLAAFLLQGSVLGLLACGIAAIILNFLVTMRLFEISFFRALALIIATKALLMLMGKALAWL